MKIKKTKPRSPGAQVTRMSARWPSLEMSLSRDGNVLLWTGPVRGFQQMYRVTVQWSFRVTAAIPHVFILDPKLRPRTGGRSEDIPHLLFNSNAPEDSALCLFDPAAGEWKPSMLIADTTVPWATEWLHHYECWHLDGVWRGANAPGPMCIGDAMREVAPSTNSAADNAGEAA